MEVLLVVESGVFGVCAALLLGLLTTPVFPPMVTDDCPFNPGILLGDFLLGDPGDPLTCS